MIVCSLIKNSISKDTCTMRLINLNALFAAVMVALSSGCGNHSPVGPGEEFYPDSVSVSVDVGNSPKDICILPSGIMRM